MSHSKVDHPGEDPGDSAGDSPGDSAGVASGGAGLGGRLSVLAGRLNALQAELVDAIVEAIATDAWRGDGIRSVAHWLATVSAGALYVGSPETVANKIVATRDTLGLDRFVLKYSAGTLPHDALMRSIELFGSKVAPHVRRHVAESPNPPSA